MSSHDKLFIEKFQPKTKRYSDTPVMDYIFGELGIKQKRRNRIARKKSKINRFGKW